MRSEALPFTGWGLGRVYAPVMVRRLLSDDPGYDPIRQVVDGDRGCVATAEEIDAADPLSVFPTLSIFVRTRTGYDDDGDPEFSWSLAVVDTAIGFVAPSEIDSIAGISVVPGRATMLYDGDVPVTSTAVAHSSFGPRYRVTSAVQIGDVLELELLDVEDADDVR